MNLAISRAARLHARDGGATGKILRTWTESDQKLLLKVTGERRAGFRDYTLYAVALGTGPRSVGTRGARRGPRCS